MRRSVVSLAVVALLAGTVPVLAQSPDPAGCEIALLGARLEDARLPDGVVWSMLRPQVETGGWMGALYDGDRYRVTLACVADGELFMQRLRDSFATMGSTVIGTQVVGDESAAVRASVGDRYLYLLVWRHGYAIGVLDVDSASGDIARIEGVASALDGMLSPQTP
jgi:hypothetical protein